MARDRTPEPTGDSTKSSWLTGRTILWAILVVVLLSFVIQNRNTTSFDFLVFSFETSLWLILAVTIVLSALVGYSVGRSKGKAKYKKK